MGAAPAGTAPATRNAAADSVDLLTMLNLDDRFAFGLERILDGLALRLGAEPPTSRRPDRQPALRM